MPIWKKPITIDTFKEDSRNTAVERLGIELTQIGDDFLQGRMPVDERTKQPFGLLHGGASVLLAETLGSWAAYCTLAQGQNAVGLDINANHIRAVTKGWVTGTARPLHIGATTQVWQIDIVNEQGKLVCISRLTMAILK